MIKINKSSAVSDAPKIKVSLLAGWTESSPVTENNGFFQLNI